MDEAALSVIGAVVSGITFLVGLVVVGTSRQVDAREALADTADADLEAARREGRPYEPSRAALRLLRIRSQRSWLHVQALLFRSRLEIAWGRLRRKDVSDRVGLLAAQRSTYRDASMSAEEMAILLALATASATCVLLVGLLLSSPSASGQFIATVLLTAFTIGVGVVAMRHRRDVRRVTEELVKRPGVAIVKHLQDALLALMEAQVFPDDAGSLRLTAIQHGDEALRIYDAFPLAVELRRLDLVDASHDTRVMAALMMEVMKGAEQ